MNEAKGENLIVKKLLIRRFKHCIKKETGRVGFEPTHTDSKDLCLTAWPPPFNCQYTDTPTGLVTAVVQKLTLFLKCDSLLSAASLSCITANSVAPLPDISAP